MNIQTLINKFINDLNIPFQTENKSVIEADGRKKDSNKLCRSGKYIYVFKDKQGQILYVGETEKGVKSRCKGDGSGCHNEKEWYKQVETIDYYDVANLSKAERKLLEMALIIKLNPVHNDK